MNNQSCLHKNNLHNNKIDPRYLEPFFVGLFEGDGSMGLCRTSQGGSGLYARFVINLKYTNENQQMLTLIKDHFGGCVSVYEHQSRTKVVWSATSKKSTALILTVFQKYPPLTSRHNSRLQYLIKCYKLNNWAYYADNRNSQYDTQDKIIAQLKKQLDNGLPSNFEPWLSGFIEAEGCFRATKYPQFVIGQNNDAYLIEAIKRLFKSNHKIQKLKNSPDNMADYYKIEIGGIPTLKIIIEHFYVYPLLGYKKVSYILFYTKVKAGLQKLIKN
jgi:hypothetical protein